MEEDNNIKQKSQKHSNIGDAIGPVLFVIAAVVIMIVAAQFMK